MKKNNKISCQLRSSRSSALKGATRIPGDKSISHRAIILGSLALGETIISGLLEGEDVLNTAQAMTQMGARVNNGGDGLWRIHGVGIGGLVEPDAILDMGNSGTSTRLLMGLVAGHDISATFTGDSSLVKRPMRRVMAPLEKMGAVFLARSGDRLPLTVKGAKDVLSIEYELPVASAQVKSAILLAALSARGRTTILEAEPTRDHTENMLRHFGIEVTVEEYKNSGNAISVVGQTQLKSGAVYVPGDPSSAAFPTVAAVLVEGSEIRLSNVLVNPRRIGLYETLKEMGADIKFENIRIESGESVATILVTSKGKLQGVEVPSARVPSMIDEFPILAIAAACADGVTRMTGLKELRVKESDRLLMIAQGLKSCGVELEMGEDSLTIHGNGKPPKGGCTIETAYDHRIAMSFLILGSVSDLPILIDDAASIRTSFPNFTDLMNDLGADISEIDASEGVDFS